jgi:hypothetical protein
MRRDIEPVAGTERPVSRLVLETKSGRTGEKQYELGLRLVVPEAWRTRLPQRHDALDADTGRRNEDFGYLVATPIRQIVEEVQGAAAASAPATARRQPA